MTILPGETACLRCLMTDTPPPGTTPTCDTAGILAPIVNIIASLQANEAIKILSGNRQAISRTLTVVDTWDNRIRQVRVRDVMGPFSDAQPMGFEQNLGVGTTHGGIKFVGSQFIALAQRVAEIDRVHEPPVNLTGIRGAAFFQPLDHIE